MSPISTQVSLVHTHSLQVHQMGFWKPVACFLCSFLVAVAVLEQLELLATFRFDGAPSTRVLVPGVTPLARGKRWQYEHAGAPHDVEVGPVASVAQQSACNFHTRHCACMSWRGNTSGCSIDHPVFSRLPRFKLSVHHAGLLWWQPEGLYRCEQSLCDVRWARQPHPQEERPAHCLIGEQSPDSAWGSADIELYPLHGRVRSIVSRSGRSITVGAWLQTPTAMELSREAHARHYFDIHAGPVPWADLGIGSMPVSEAELRQLPARAPRYVAMLLLQRNCASDVEAAYLRQLALRVTVHDVSGCPGVLGTPLFSQIASVCGPRPTADGWLPALERWQQCMLEHHAFFMAPQCVSTGGESIVRTLSLWAGLKAGSVPVFLPPASQDLTFLGVLAHLSDPFAIVNASNFASVDELAGHLASAQADAAVLEMHQRWRRTPFTASFLAALRDPPSRLPCRVCDYVAEQQQSSAVSVAAGATGNSLVLPACLARLFSQQHLPIVNDWAAAEDPAGQHLSVYVASLGTATDRHARLKQQLASVGLRASLLAGFDREQLDEDTAACWYPQSPFEGRTVMEERSSLGLGEVSLAAKHFVGYFDILARGLPNALFLEDDVRFDATSFHGSLRNATAALPDGWDMLFLGGCREPPTLAAKASAAVHPQSGAWGSFAYLVSYQGALKMLRSLPLRWPIDFQINAAVHELGLRVFCASELVVRHEEAGPSFLASERARGYDG